MQLRPEVAVALPHSHRGVKTPGTPARSPFVQIQNDLIAEQRCRNQNTRIQLNLGCTWLCRRSPSFSHSTNIYGEPGQARELLRVYCGRQTITWRWVLPGSGQWLVLNKKGQGCKWGVTLVPWTCVVESQQAGSIAMSGQPGFQSPTHRDTWVALGPSGSSNTIQMALACDPGQHPTNRAPGTFGPQPLPVAPVFGRRPSVSIWLGTCPCSPKTSRAPQTTCPLRPVGRCVWGCRGRDPLASARPPFPISPAADGAKSRALSHQCLWRVESNAAGDFLGDERAMFSKIKEWGSWRGQGGRV